MKKKSPTKKVHDNLVAPSGPPTGPPALLTQINDEIATYSRALYSHLHDFQLRMTETSETFLQRIKG